MFIRRLVSSSRIIGLKTGRLLSSTCYTFSTRLAMANYQAVQVGQEYDFSYRVYFRNQDGPISPWHDIPLFANEEKTILNMVVEIPRWTNAKMEIATKDKLNSIKQDIKKGKLRFVHNIFPHHGYMWNYGAFPQTWEDPNHVDANTSCKGDNDPLDVCEIGYKVGKRGEIKQVKVLGVMAMIDEGETDWKILAIDVTDPLADKINDVDDIPKYMPNFLEATHNWFRDYKIPAGKPPNQFAFSGEAKNKQFAMGVIHETHNYWRDLVNGACDDGGMNRANTATTNNNHKISTDEAQKEIDAQPSCQSPASIDQSVNKWQYV
ncbi:expressed hypothetical protein [Trichoplax adhaerens]|uniref:Inorganic pyrophosphatase n=1 Tax=Trichoplax adhaerens TaxID=10228 RepID=B3RW07_TRIAD|nr:expressed hypothetical protein [Trichoplax adhaerens]EDV25588.1 expressed hypothetical protein [Trichoplax adhaerens]|eukprot:XP_002111621.1 expressed hypothetical protein [Trichoplax adhaerens]